MTAPTTGLGTGIVPVPRARRRRKVDSPPAPPSRPARVEPRFSIVLLVGAIAAGVLVVLRAMDGSDPSAFVVASAVFLAGGFILRDLEELRR
jgi:hypothetical protein